MITPITTTPPVIPAPITTDATTSEYALKTPTINKETTNEIITTIPQDAKTIMASGGAFNIFKLQMTPQLIEKIKDTKDSNGITSIWDIALDKIFKTHRVKIKKNLHELIHTSDGETKIKKYKELKTLVATESKDQFTYTVTAMNDALFTINLSIGELLSTRDISTKGKKIKLNKEITTYTKDCINDKNINLTQLIKDISRSEIYFSSDTIKNERLTEEMLQNIIDKISVAQKKSLDVALSQTGIIDITRQINEHSEGMPFVGDPSKKTSCHLDENGYISIETQLFQNIDVHSYSAYQQIFSQSKYPYVYAKAHIGIDRSGNCTISNITLSHPGIE